MKRKLYEVGAADGRVREIGMTTDDLLIGRGDDCEVCLRDPEISRHHCLIRTRSEIPVLTDLGSSNGTFLNGHRLLSQANLVTGDEIRVGPFRFFVDLGDNPDFRLPDESGVDPLAATRMMKDVKKTK